MSWRFSAHLGYLFTELPLEARFAAARAAGFDAVELPMPATLPAARMAALLAAEGLGFPQMAATPGVRERGEKGIAALPGREAEFRAEFARALDYAEAIGCPLVHPLAGVPPADATTGAVWETYLANLAHAVESCRGRAVGILIEPISTAAVPGYFLSTADYALRAADRVAPDRTLLLLDTFHAQASGLDPAAFIARHWSRLGHVHIADHPGRHEPGSGRIDFAAVLAALGAAGYTHAIGFEYVPAGSTRDGLGWLPGWRQLTAEPAGSEA